MAKKVKRKVSAVTSPTAPDGGNVSVAEAPAAPVPTATTTTARSYSSRRATAGGPVEFNPDYSYIVSDLKRVGVLAGTFFVILIALSFILPMIMK